jgi:hypothetical protein
MRSIDPYRNRVRPKPFLIEERATVGTIRAGFPMLISEAKLAEKPIRSISAPTVSVKQNSAMDPDNTRVAIIEIPAVRYIAHVSMFEFA